MKKLNVEYKKKKYIIWFDIRDGELKIGVTDEKNSSISSRLQKAILKNLFRFRNSYVSDGKKVYTYMDNDLKRFFDENGVEDYERFLEDNDFSEIIKINSSKISRKQVFKTSLAAIYIALQPFSLWGSATQDKIEQVSRVHLNLRDNSKNIMLINDENDIKKHIENNTFLTDVQKEALLSFEIYDEIAALNLSIERQQELISLLQNLCVRGFDLEELLENLESIKVSQQPSLLGYVSPLEEEQNVIHLWDENEISTFYHEFVHVLQDCNYSYLNEPTAEIIASEFSDGIVADSYSNARIRVCVLMEIIGSEPVFEAVFKDSSLLEQKIHELLPDELDYNFFISHLYASPQWETDDASFDQLLAKMYFNKYHLDIKDDPLIQGIYRCGSDSGFYNNTIDAGTYGNYYVDEYLPYKRYYFNEDKMKDFNFQGEAYDSDSDFYLDATDEFEQGNIDIENPRLIVDVPISEEEFNRLSSGDDSIEIIDCYDIDDFIKGSSTTAVYYEIYYDEDYDSEDSMYEEMGPSEKCRYHKITKNDISLSEFFDPGFLQGKRKEYNSGLSDPSCQAMCYYDVTLSDKKYDTTYYIYDYEFDEDTNHMIINCYKNSVYDYIVSIPSLKNKIKNNEDGYHESVSVEEVRRTI